MKVIVIGAPDPVACRASRLMAAAGHQVTAVSCGSQQPAAGIAGIARVVHVRDPRSLAAAFCGHDAICDLGTVPDSPAGAALYALRARERHNKRQLAAAVESAVAASGVHRWVQRSTATGYTDGGHTWLNEASPVTPSPLIRGCLDAEACAAGHAARGGAAITLRFGTVYGPDDPATRALVRMARKGWQPLDGPPAAYRPTITSDDAARAVVQALQAPPGTYNITDHPHTVQELTDILSSAVGGQLHPLWPAVRRAEREYVTRSQRVNAAAYTAATGWKAIITPAQGLPDAIQTVPLPGGCGVAGAKGSWRWRVATGWTCCYLAGPR